MYVCITLNIRLCTLRYWLQMTTEGIFDFLRGDRTISVTATDTETLEIPKETKNETWTLYTLNPESKDCPLDCLIVSVHKR